VTDVDRDANSSGARPSSIPPTRALDSRAARVGRWLCLASAAIGGAGMLDAVAGTRLLTVFAPGEPLMTANTALGLSLIGVAGALRQREDAALPLKVLSVVAALLVLAIGVVTIAEYVLGTDLGIDRVITTAAGPGWHPGRPALPSALALTLLAAALLVFDVRPVAGVRPSECLIVAAGLIALTALFGFVFGAELRNELMRAPLIGTALPTAVALLIASVGMLLERPHAGMMGVATSAGPGGRQLRRFVLPALLVPALLGFIIAFPLRAAGTHALAVAVALLASTTALAGLVVLTMTAVSLNRTYEALEASRASARSLVEEAPDAVFVADLTGRYTDVNSAACRLVGYSREEILGKTIADLILPGELERLSRTRDRLLQGDAGVSEWTLRCKDGSEVSVEVSAKIFPDGRWQGLVRDVSERRRLVRELREAEARQKFLADFGSALVSTIDDHETVEVVARRVVATLADACSIETLEEDGRLHARVFVHRDPAMAAICRRFEALQLDTRQQYLGSAVRDARRPLLIADVTPGHLDAIAQNAEHRYLLRQIEPRSFMALPLLAHGGVVGSIVFVSATEGHRYTEEDLPFAEQVAMRAALAVEKARLYRIAQDAIRLRDDVLNVVAHDLRNPLGTILLQAGLLRRRQGQGEGERRTAKPAEMIERSATRMNHLIQDLLDVARMEGGRLNIQRARVAARQTVADAVQTQEPLATSGALELRLDVPFDLPELWADRDRLLQVFENLIGNAIKFTEPGGSITVGAVPREEEVLFWVADTGIGMAAGDLPRVFERLWQASGGGRRGAGLGLPIVKGIVEAHGGRIWVESALGAGSTFFFTIPVAGFVEGWRPEPAPQI
jgi:PAS domain S-box-containing protein